MANWFRLRGTLTFHLAIDGDYFRPWMPERSGALI